MKNRIISVSFSTERCKTSGSPSSIVEGDSVIDEPWSKGGITRRRFIVFSISYFVTRTPKSK
ncbi:MAG: hypothetical protein ACOCN0_07745, partial [Prevotella sp.]